MTEPVEAEAIAQTVVDALQKGPLAVDDLLTRLAEASTFLSVEDLGELRAREYLPFVWDLSDGRLVDIRVLLAGRIFTHRISATEIDRDLLTIAPDLEPLAMLTDGPELFEIDGTATDVIEHGSGAVADGEAFSVATGSLAGVREGDLIGLRVESGAATLDLHPQPGETPGSLLEKLRGAVRDDGEIQPVFGLDAVLQLCADDPGLFTSPLAPLSEIADSAGLAIWGDYLASKDFDVRSWMLSGEVETVQAIFGLSAELAGAVVELGIDIRSGPMVSAKLHTTGERAGIVTAATALVLSAMHVPDVPQALSVEVLKADTRAAGDLVAWVDQQRTAALPRARPGLLWLQGTARRRAGEMLAAEGSFQAALDLDPRYRAALLDLADIASDRGERERAISLLRRAEVADDDPMLVLLESLAPEAGPQLGRNDPCWCGSGRKFKQCHLNRPAELSLSDRARWLHFKAVAFVQGATFQPLLLELAAVRSPEHSSPDDDVLMKGLDDDPLTADLALFEGGGLEQFLAVQRELLPEDDLDLATSWLAISRSVYEIEGMDPRTNVTLRDLRSGDSVEIKGHAQMAPIRPGRRLCARLLPVGTEFRVFGGIEPVSEEGTDSLIELLDEIDDDLDEQLGREIPDELVELLAGMDPGELDRPVAEAARQLAASGRFPDVAAVHDYNEDEDEDEDFNSDYDYDEDEDRTWAATALMAALTAERSAAR